MVQATPFAEFNSVTGPDGIRKASTVMAQVQH